MSGSHCNPRMALSSQDQSPFFNRLPAEIRNKIYTYVFTRDTSSFTKYQTNRPPHQFCFLSTCRLVHAEAHTLAFRTYTFPLPSSMHPTYTNLRNVVADLPAPRLLSITSLSLFSSRQPAEYLTNALLVFPALRYFVLQEVGTLTGATPERCSRSHASTGLACPKSISNGDITRRSENRAVARYAPRVLTHLVHAVASGEAYRWQTGEKWQVEWPQLESESMYTKIRSEFNELEEDLVFDTDALGAIDGVEICGCGCGDVSWTGVDLVQEGGRRVHVRVVYCTRADQYAYDPSFDKYHKIRLIPGTTPATEVVAESAGFRYEPDEEYWESMRRKNGDLGAWCRGLWKRAMAFENESYSRLTGQGREAADLV
ncbi:hypothetical protein E8E11_009105 [Didymella keratinophila]|nr:hypothetical protein E8E11_009105 [Didymella keratinophila]